MKDSINLGGVHLTPHALKAIQNLQENDNEALQEHINRLSNVATWIGKDLDGFDPECADDQEAIRSIVSISNTVAFLKSLAVK